MARLGSGFLKALRFVLRAGRAIRPILVALALACALAGSQGCRARPSESDADDAGSALAIGGCRTDQECHDDEQCSPTPALIGPSMDSDPAKWFRRCVKPNRTGVSDFLNDVVNYGDLFHYAGVMYGCPPVQADPSIEWAAPRLVEGIGRLDADAFFDVVAAWHGWVKACYLDALLTGNEFSGVMDVRFDIYEDGRIVAEVTRADPSVEDSGIRLCLQDAVRLSGAEAIMMQRPPVGGSASVLVSLEFVRGNVGRWVSERPTSAGWKGEGSHACGAHPWAKMIAGEGYEGVLFEGSGWTPTDEEVGQAERLITTQLAALRPAPELRARDLPTIVTELSSYQRQYVPLPARDGDERLLQVTFLREAARMHPEWEFNLVSVCNEWPEDFHLEVALDSGRCDKLEMHPRRWHW